DPRRVAMFEPVHGSAPALAGSDAANPFAALLTVGMMMAHLGWPDEERRIEAAVAAAIDAGQCTPDVGGSLGTRAAGAWVRQRIADLRMALATLRLDAGSPRLRDELRRRVHALSAGARLLRFEAMGAELVAAERILEGAALVGGVDVEEMRALGETLERLPTL